ncbi:alanine racemase [Desulfomicrobium escambiense]|uniref:alanine racemase n=1 Tax=Desulfomicrobium escambiense TaxID=29503 RepID=UPI0003F84307|nr:alanine racemase [Desulfomicrobium escambiense]
MNALLAPFRTRDALRGLPCPLEALDTPCLLLDEARMDGNIARLRNRLAAAGVAFRPHLKTAKSWEISRRLMATPHGPATVSTLREAEALAACGVTDITYAVGIAPQKLPRVLALRRQGVDLTVLLDSVAQARAVAAASDPSDPIPALIELDCDGHRSGVQPGDSQQLLAIAHALKPTARLRGVLVHAGESYEARGEEALAAAAEGERAAAVEAARTLRDAGWICPVVSVGSTPTAFSARSYEGVTEVRAGVFVFFDLVQVGIGICAIDDIAVSVLTTVIGHQRDKGWAIVDAGWTAMSCDRGTAGQTVDQGYGLVCYADGRPVGDLVVRGVNQEHGVVAPRSGNPADLPDLPVGTRLRILPSHACATVTQFDRYHVVGAGGEEVTAVWPRLMGW